MKVIGYVRVSTEEQAREGVSLAAQEKKLVAYADVYEVELVEIVADAGVSAKTLKRPGLARALARLEDGSAQGLLIAKLDRLTRSVADWNALIDQYLLREAALLSVGEQIDTRTAAGRLVLNVLVSVAQWEREAIGERTAAAMAHLKAQGVALGAPRLARLKRKPRRWSGFSSCGPRTCRCARLPRPWLPKAAAPSAAASGPPRPCASAGPGGGALMPLTPAEEQALQALLGLGLPEELIRAHLLKLRDQDLEADREALLAALDQMHPQPSWPPAPCTSWLTAPPSWPTTTRRSWSAGGGSAMRKGNPYLQIRLEPHVLELLKERSPPGEPGRGGGVAHTTCGLSCTTTWASVSPPASPLSPRPGARPSAKAPRSYLLLIFSPAPRWVRGEAPASPHRSKRSSSWRGSVVNGEPRCAR